MSLRQTIQEEIKKLKEAEERESDESDMNEEDLEECDEYNLPEWWDDDRYELRPIKNGEDNEDV